MSGPPSLSYDTELGSGHGPPPSLTGVSFAYSTLENALPAILEEVDCVTTAASFFLVEIDCCAHFFVSRTRKHIGEMEY